jgi:hypothetical protein
LQLELTVIENPSALALASGNKPRTENSAHRVYEVFITNDSLLLFGVQDIAHLAHERVWKNRWLG